MTPRVQGEVNSTTNIWAESREGAVLLEKLDWITGNCLLQWENVPLPLEVLGSTSLYHSHLLLTYTPLLCQTSKYAIT